MIGERFLFFYFFFLLLLLSLLRWEENRREILSRHICLFLSCPFFFLFLSFSFFFSSFCFALINQTLIQKPMSQQPPRLVCRSPSRLRRCAKFRRLCSCSCWIQAGSFQSVSTYLFFPPHFYFFFSPSGIKKRKNKQTVTYDPPSKKHNIAVTVNGKLVSSLPPTSPDNLGKSPSPPKNPPLPEPN